MLLTLRSVAVSKMASSENCVVRGKEARAHQRLGKKLAGKQNSVATKGEERE